MKTIEERAEAYVNRHNSLHFTRLLAYLNGATEQKQIDEQHILFLSDAHEHEKKLLIDKACEWLEDNAIYYVGKDGVTNWRSVFADFRKYMKGE